MSFKRVLQPSPVHNTKNILYSTPSLDLDDCELFLDSALDGVYGIEGTRTPFEETFNIVAPLFFKSNWVKVEGDSIKDFLDGDLKETTYVQFYLDKPSVFPIEMYSENPIWDSILEVCPNSLSIMYQFLWTYRQDNWVLRLEEQYEDYLNGVEQPSSSKFFRKIQRTVNEKLDSVLKWEYKHTPIDEIDSKLTQRGYRFSFRMVLQGSSKKVRLNTIKKIQSLLNEQAYLNRWTYLTPSFLGETLEDMRLRKLNSVGKQEVLCLSEMTPFLMRKEVEEIDIQTILEPEIEEVVLTKDDVPSEPSILDLLPKSGKLKDVNGEEYALRFINALKEVQVTTKNIVTKNMQFGANMMKLTFELPKGLKLSTLLKPGVKGDLQVHMGVKDIHIEQGEEMGELAVYVPLEKRRKVFLRDYIDTDKFKEFAEKNALPFLVGIDNIGEPLFRDIGKAKHILVAGTTGSGKSTLINQLILTVAMFKDPSEVHMYMIDVKRVELTRFRSFPHVKDIVTTAEDAIKLLEKLNEEVKRRYVLLEKTGVNNIGLYNSKFQDNKLEYIICVIDEYAELVLEKEEAKEIHKNVQSLAQLSRAVGVHLILATQDPRKEVILPIIKSNMPSKIALNCSNDRSYGTFLRQKPPFKLLGNGDGALVFDNQREDFIRFQGCLIIDDPKEQNLEAEIIEKIGQELTAIAKEGGKTSSSISKSTVDIKPTTTLPTRTDLDKLKGLIIKYEETRVGRLRDLMRINTNKLNDLMKDLVNEGFLAEPETRQSGYKLVASEEEIAKVRDYLKANNL